MGELGPAPESMLFQVRTNRRPNTDQMISLCRGPRLGNTSGFAYNSVLQLLSAAREQQGIILTGDLVSQPARYPGLFDVQNNQTNKVNTRDREIVADHINALWAEEGQQLFYVLMTASGAQRRRLFAGRFRGIIASESGLIPMITGPEPLWYFTPGTYMDYPEHPLALPLQYDATSQAIPSRHLRGRK